MSTHSKHLDVTVRATNGAAWEIHRFAPQDTVAELADFAVRHFVDAKAMAPGDYDISLVVDGTAQPPLSPGATLADAGVADHAVLALSPHQPQVDG